MIKKLLVIGLISSSLCAEVEYMGNVSLEMRSFTHDLSNKRDHSVALRLETELKQEFDNAQVVAKIKAIYDKDDNSRRYLDFNDLYYMHSFENSDILIGRSTVFWGALEFYNITDVFNTKDLLDDPFDYNSKLGSWNITQTTYLEDSEISIMVKLHESNQKMQDAESVNYFLPLAYNDKLSSEEGEFRPTIFLKYSGYGEDVQIDYSIIYQNGYDSQRYLRVKDNKFQQNAYIVNKLLGFATLIDGDTIYKVEATYADSKSRQIDNYAQLGVGVEHTLYGFSNQRDMGLLVEYYRHESDQKSQSFFTNDLVLGLRVSMNDAASSSILAGLNIDLDNHEKIFIVKYDTRVYESYKLALSYQHMSPEEDSLFQKLDLVKLEFGYYF